MKKMNFPKINCRERETDQKQKKRWPPDASAQMLQTLFLHPPRGSPNPVVLSLSRMQALSLKNELEEALTVNIDSSDVDFSKRTSP